MSHPIQRAEQGRPAVRDGHPTIALVLGGGGARGLAHVLMLEAFDELGVRPKVIAGTSIGAIFGWAYASGLPARRIRAHVEEVLRGRLDMLQTIAASSTGPLFRIFNMSRSSLLRPEKLLDLVLPSHLAHDFAQLRIPLKVVATDFYAQEPIVFETGPLRHAVAASMALPLVFSPVMHHGRALVDGGLVNPLPFDVVAGLAEITVAIDVTGGPIRAAQREHPSAFEALFYSYNILGRTIIHEKLKVRPPELVIQPSLDRFRVLDFHKVSEILAAAQPWKDELKRALDVRLEAVLVEEGPAAEQPTPIEPPTRRRLLPRRPRLKLKREPA